MSYSSVVLADPNLVSFWDLQEGAGATTMVDSKSGLNLTGSGTYTLGVAGPGGSLATAWVGDGSTGIANRSAAGTALDFAGQITMECWAKVNGSNPSDWGYFVSRNASYEFGCRTSGLLSVSAGGSFPDSTANGVVPGAWAHYAAVVNATPTATFYANGVQIGSPVACSAVTTGPFTIVLGSEAGGGFFVNATIAGLAIYNTGLSGATILAHYNAMAGSPVQRQVGAWSTRSGGY